MTQFGAPLHEDVNGLKTSAEWDGTKWVYQMVTPTAGSDGEITDAAVTDPASSGTIISLLKGLLTFLRISPAGLGKTEDLVHATGDTGIMPLAVRTDTPAVLSGATGEYTPLQTNSLGSLRVLDTSWVSTDAAVTDPAVSASGISLLKGLLTFLRVSALGLGKAEDAVHATGDTGIMPLAVRVDTAATLASATGDYTPLQTDNLGSLRVVTPVGFLLNARTTALAETKLVKAAAGTLFGFQGYTTLDGFVQVHADVDGVLTAGAQALEVIKVAAPSGGLGGPFSIDFGQYGIAIPTGITIAFSTTGPTYTAGGANMFVSAQYQ